ncbi:MAG TPA: hypothetical protein VFA26_24175 [Gemmataceae bacterium]|nr:hypothetical protein [Gemmataceae bacterium]
MTAKESVFELLKQQKQLDHDDKRSDHKARQKEWVKALRDLMGQLAAWLKDAERQGLLRIEEVSHTLEEERLGPSYTAPGLKVVTPGGVTVHVRPKARYVVGAQGRVDMDCPPKKAILVRKAPAQWQVAELAPAQGGWAFKDLDEDSFWEALRDLLS